MERFNIGAELVERNLREGRGERVAIWHGGRTLTYREVAQQVDAAALALLHAGVRPEERVLFILPDSPELVACYLGAMKIGAVAVPCNPLLRSADYAYFLEESRARLLVTAQSCLDRVEPALSGQAALRRVVVAGADGERSFQRFIAEPAARPVATAETSRDEAAYWLWTSG